MSSYNNLSATHILNALRHDLTSNPITFNGYHDSIMDLIYNYYTEFVPTETIDTKELELTAVEAIQRLIQRNDATGEDSQNSQDATGDGENLIDLLFHEISECEHSAFNVGFAAGARLVFELMGEGPVGVV